MNTPRKILYMQHAGALGGSCMSLLYTMQGIDHSRFEPVVALARPSPELVDFYARAGFEVLPWPGMVLWDHSTVAPMPLYDPRSWLHLWQVWRCWGRTQRRTLELIDTVKPDIVHLNSMPLSPCADILSRKGVPFVWHVREPPQTSFGLRYRFIRKLMLKANELIFISKSDQRAWVQNNHGQVVHNFVDFSRFDSTLNSVLIRGKFGILSDAPVILYVGGFHPIKGIFPMLEALAELKKRFVKLRCLMPGTIYEPSNSLIARMARKVLPLLGSGTNSQKIHKIIEVADLKDTCIFLPFQTNIAPLYAACDVLVFPAIVPHFARPVIEASAMGKPSVGSDLGGVNELIEHDHTGLLVEPGSPIALAEALKELLTNPERLKNFGENALIKARKEFDAKQQVAKITKIYDSILG